MFRSMSEGIAGNVEALLSGFEFEKLKSMNITEVEIIAEAERFADDIERRGCAFWSGLRKGYIAGRAMSQNLQQCNVMWSLPPVSELEQALNLAQAELKAMYQRLGYKGSNVLDLVDAALEKVQAAMPS